MTTAVIEILWMIPATPLAAALILLFSDKPRPNNATAAGIREIKSHRRRVSAIAIVGQSAVFLMALCVFLNTLRAPGLRDYYNITWFTFGDIPMRIGWMLDPLTAAMLLMVTFVGLCIFVFSAGYMAEDVNIERFFAYLSFFSAAMLGVVISNSLLLLFICWELVGLASYLLIGFWIEKPAAAAAAKKAFVTTRIGDIGLFLGLLWLYSRTGTLLLYDEGGGCLEPAALAVLGTAAAGIALLIYCGAAGKSGQFPLHVWLPDAMEGPTPVSALIHAATMVAAGVFLVARVYPIFSSGAVNGVTPALTVVVWIGAITGLIGALIAAAQWDIKRILAYSTVSQLGLMMVSLGVGGVTAGILHLLAHGFFKALLFLGSGSVIYGSHHEQDIRRMGGLRRRMPVTFAAYSAGMMALSGVPLLFCGAWTKEEILHAAHQWPVSSVPFYLVLAGVFLTAFYMTRQMVYVFFGDSRAHAGDGHGASESRPVICESPLVMTIPLIVLAVCVVTLSAVLTPAWPWLADYLAGVPVLFKLADLIGPMLFISLPLVAGGIGFAAWIYRHAGETDPVARSHPALFRFLENKMWIDEFYGKTILAWSFAAARVSDWLDRYVWDGCVRVVAGLGALFAFCSANFDEGGINTGVDQGCDAAQSLGRRMSAWHSGRVQIYLRTIGLGMLALVILYILLT